MSKNKRSTETTAAHLASGYNSVLDSNACFIDVTSGCGVTQASESWELVVTVQLCPPRPNSLPNSTIGNASCSCSSNGRARRFERRGCGFKSCQEFHY